MNSNLIYDINDKPKKVYEWLLYALQQLFAVFVATVLIANVCGTPVSSCLFGAGVATLVYQVITKFQSPMFISSCGATCSAVIGALAMGEGNNYLAVAVGGLIILAVYFIVAVISMFKGVKAIQRIFPPIIIGPVTMVIGLNLAGFIPTYVQVNGMTSVWGVIIAIFTMLVIAITSHYAKGFGKTIPFLVGLLSGYGLALILTVTGVARLINFSIFSNMQLFKVPDFTWAYMNSSLSGSDILQVIVLFAPVAICSLLEHISDHTVLSNIIGTNLLEKPGLHRTLLGDGIASAVGTLICGLPNTSYGESIATTGFSRVASVRVLSLTALMLIVMSFLHPVQLFIMSIPSCVFGGCAMILYGYIAASGLRTLFNANIDFTNNKNLVVISVILTVGVSGIFLFSEAFAGVSLAMVLGVILNLILRERK